MARFWLAAAAEETGAEVWYAEARAGWDNRLADEAG